MTEDADKPARDARDWIVRLNSGQVSEAELARFKAWRDASAAHRRAFEDERAFWTLLQGLEVTKVQKPRLARRGFLAGGAAAMAGAAGVLFVPQLAVALRADFQTKIGQIATFTLPDGGSVTLNTDSAVTLDFASGQRRAELLRGEAEFTVQAGPGRFGVLSCDGLTETGQGRFSVRLKQDLAIVTAYEGQLEVTSGPTGQVVSLQAGQQTSYGTHSPLSAPQAVDPELAAAWLGGRVIFEGHAFSQAVNELGRYLPERVVIAPNVAHDVPVSGVFSTAQALDALDALARTQGLSLHRLPGVMILIA